MNPFMCYTINLFRSSFVLYLVAYITFPQTVLSKLNLFNNQFHSPYYNTEHAVLNSLSFGVNLNS